MFLLLLRNTPCRENSLSTTLERGCSPDPMMNFTLGHPEEKTFADVSVRVTMIFQIPGNGSFVRTPLLPCELPRRAGSNHPLTPRLPHLGQMEPRSKTAGQGRRPCLPRPCTQLSADQHLRLSNLLTASGAKIASILSCLDGVISIFNSNCLKALVIKLKHKL